MGEVMKQDSQLQEWATQIKQHIRDGEQKCMEGMQDFAKAGAKLKKVNERLAQKGNGTFGKWVGEHVGITSRHARNLIRSAGVMGSLGTIVPILPATESQCRELAKLPEEEIPAVWEKVVEVAGDKPVTAKMCKEAVDAHTWGEEGKLWSYEHIEEEDHDPEAGWAHPLSVRLIPQAKRISGELCRLFVDNLELDVSKKDGERLAYLLSDFVSHVPSIHEAVGNILSKYKDQNSE